MTNVLASKLVVALLCLSFFTQAQPLVLTRKPNVDIHPECKGYLEYLPNDYATSGKTYPLLIVVHGTGEIGSGSFSDLGKLINIGPMRLINNGTFPASFTIGSVTRQFIIIAPQFNGYRPDKSDHIEAVLKYAIDHYRLDPTRLYASGLSMGGKYVWNLAASPSGSKLAGVVPIAGSSESFWWIANPIAASNIPVWATTNYADPTVNPAGTIGTVQLVNDAATNKSLAKASVFYVPGHDAWTKTYDPVNFKEEGLNIYEWLLTKTRVGNVVLPVVLKKFDATLAGSQVTLSWVTTFEENNNFFTLERSADGTNFTLLTKVPSANNNNGSTYTAKDASPVDGLNYYRLSQTDKDGKTVYFEIVKILVGRTEQDALLNVYPNPAVHQLGISMNNSARGPLNISVIANDGRIVRTYVFNKGLAKWNQNIDVSSLSPGYYLLKLNIGTVSFNEKFIKQ